MHCYPWLLALSYPPVEMATMGSSPLVSCLASLFAGFVLGMCAVWPRPR